MTESRMIMVAAGIGCIIAAILIWVRMHLGGA
jgi:hypothetical protein